MMNLGAIKMLDSLLSELSDDDIDVRENAIEQIIELKDPTSIFPLLGMLKSQNSSTRAGVVRILGEIAKITEENLAENLLPLLSDEDLFVQLQTCTAFEQIGSFEAFEPLFKIIFLEDLERDPENLLGRTALVTLSSISHELLVKNLISLLQDPNSTHRHIAAYWLGEIKAIEAIDCLLYCLSDPNIEIYISIIEALGKIANPQAVRPLFSILENIADTEENETLNQIKEQIILALAQIPSQETILIDLLANSNVAKRRLSAWALGHISNKTAISSLFKALADKDIEVQWFAIHALEILADPQAIKPLSNLLTQEPADLRQKAVQAIGNIGTDLAINPLIFALNDPDVNVKYFAIQALGQVGQETVLDLLTTYLTDPDPTIRNVSIKALSRIKSPKITPLLINMLSDSDETVFYSAILALEEIGDKLAIKPLENKLNDISDPFLADSIKSVIEKIISSKNALKHQTEDLTN
jgi:HEAT repeat protein